MKPFNLERALAGDPVVMSDGTPVKVVFCSDLPEDYPVLCVYENKYTKDSTSRWVKKDGKEIEDEESDTDLFMAPNKKKVFIAIDRMSFDVQRFSTTNAYTDKDYLKVDENRMQIIEVEIEVDE